MSDPRPHKYAVFVRFPDGWQMEGYTESRSFTGGLDSIKETRDAFNRDHPDKRIFVCKVLQIIEPEDAGVA